MEIQYTDYTMWSDDKLASAAEDIIETRTTGFRPDFSIIIKEARPLLEQTGLPSIAMGHSIDIVESRIMMECMRRFVNHVNGF